MSPASAGLHSELPILFLPSFGPVCSLASQPSSPLLSHAEKSSGLTCVRNKHVCPGERSKPPDPCSSGGLVHTEGEPASARLHLAFHVSVLGPARQSTHTGWLRTAAVYSLTILGAGSLRPWVWQGCTSHRGCRWGPTSQLHLQGQHLHTSPCSVFTSPSLCVRWPSASPRGTPVIPFNAHPPGQPRLLSHLEILILTTPANACCRGWGAGKGEWELGGVGE